MRHSKSNKFAFSLIEISIVILIIGVLVIGITKGSRIIYASKLSSAKSLTLNSPVQVFAENLGPWFDASAEKSFSTTGVIPQNGSAVTTWYDMNSYSEGSNRVNVSFGGGTVQYIANATNGLPGVRLSNPSYMSKNNVLSNALTKDGVQVTIFAVAKDNSTTDSTRPVYWIANASFPRILMLAGADANQAARLEFGIDGSSSIGYNTPTSFLGKTNIISMVRRPNGRGVIKINGTIYANNVFGDTFPHQSGVFRLGDETTGELYEIIIFKTALKESEITEIEKYLSKKWGVKLAGCC